MKNKRNFIKRHRIQFTIGFFIVVGILMIIWNRNNDEPKACGADQCFVVEVARTQEEHQRGLMYRESMPEMSGMLFVFEIADIYNFWMKNTLIPLDMLWIDEKFNVVKIHTAEPCTADPCPIYQPGKTAKYVLEINAGMAAKHGIAEGTTMRFVNIQ